MEFSWKWGVPKHYLEWEVVPDHNLSNVYVLGETWIINFFKLVQVDKSLAYKRVVERGQTD